MCTQFKLFLKDFKHKYKIIEYSPRTVPVAHIPIDAIENNKKQDETH